MDIQDVISEFKTELSKRGYPANIVWLQENQMHLSKGRLSIFCLGGFPYEEHVINAFNNIFSSSDICDGTTLMLVAADERISYCTLLLDSFGSESDLELDKNIFIWASPYAPSVRFIATRFQWFCTKFLNKRVLSCLDYAFSIRQSYT